MSVKLSNVAHPVSVVAAGVSPQPTSDASMDTASSAATSSGSNARDHAEKKTYSSHIMRKMMWFVLNYTSCILFVQ